MKFNFAAKKINLRERLNQQLTVAHNGGLFKATPTLMSFLKLYTPAILEDEFNNPIKIDQEKLMVQLEEAYAYATNAWHDEFEKHRRIRKGSDLNE